MFTRASLYTCNACVQLSLQGKKRHAHSSSNLLSSSFLQTSNSSFLNLKSERSGCFPEFNRKWFSKQGLFCMLDKKMSHASSPKIVMNPTDINKEIINNIPEFSDPYKPFWGIKNGHFDTIFAAVFRSRPAINFKREVLRMEDGGSVALDWPLSYESGERFYKKKLPPNAPQIILLPGLTGGSNDSYVCHLAQNAKNEDFGVVVFNSRGCADSPVTTPQFYSASFTEDLRQVVKHVSNKHPSSKIYAVGWSLGANILVRYLGQEKDETVLSGAVSLANPFDLVLADKNFHVGFNNFYDKRLSKSLNKIFRKHAPLFEDIKGEYDIQLVSMAKSVREFDDGLTRVSFGYSTVDEYYSDASSSKSIKDVKIPLLCIQAHDDPIAPVDGIPFKDIQENDNCLLAVTPFGGHIGWMTGNKFPIGAPWTDAPVIKYLLALESLFPNQLSQANRTDPALALGSGNGSGISDTVEV